MSAPAWIRSDWRAWRRLLPVWLPAVVLCVASIVLYAWQTSGSVGTAASLTGDIEELQAEIERLERIRDEAAEARTQVERVQQRFQVLYGEVFGSLDERLSRILRAVGAATREAGLYPGSYSYQAEQQRAGQYRFSVQFNVEGRYEQIRRLLAELQTSPEFLIVDNVSFAGEEEAMHEGLRISIRVSTYLAEADEEDLRRLTGGIVADDEADDAEAGDA